MKASTSQYVPRGKAKEIKDAFSAFDRDASGTLTADELVAILCHPNGGQAFSAAEARALIRKFDTNGDGVLDYAEFVKAFSTLAPNIKAAKK